MSSTSGFVPRGHGVGLPPLSGSMARRAEAAAGNARQEAPLPAQRGVVAPSGPRSPVNDDQHIGKKIRELRRAKSLTQQELAAMVGVTGVQLHRYEAGTTRVAASRLLRIAEGLGVPVDALMGSRSAERRPPLQAEAPRPMSDGGDGIAELITFFCQIADPKDRRAVVTLGRMLAEKAVPMHGANTSD